VRSPNEVLILESRAFAPTSWEEWSVKQFFESHEISVQLFPRLNDPTEDPIERYDHKTKNQDWEIDFSSTYFLHAFNRGVTIPSFAGVAVKYILDRKSKFKLATWPIIQIGLEEGVFFFSYMTMLYEDLIAYVISRWEINRACLELTPMLEHIRLYD